jgi:hypothetical protein
VCIKTPDQNFVIIEGRQENKRVKIRFKAEKEGEAKKETLTKFKVKLKLKINRLNYKNIFILILDILSLHSININNSIWCIYCL